MIYKKIGDKIPSLSSLLLAGMLSPFGGCEGCGDKGAKPTEEPGTKTSNDASMVKDESQKSPERSSDFMQTLKNIYSYLLDACAQLGAVSSPNRPDFLKENELAEKDGSTLKKTVETFFKSFGDEENLKTYPKCIYEELKSLSFMKAFASGSDRGLSNKHAYGSAVNEIALAFRYLYDLKDKIESEVKDKDADITQMNKFASDVKEFRQSLAKKFNKETPFHGTKKSVLMANGVDLTKFFNGTTKAGDEREVSDAKLTKMPDILQEGIPVLIVNKNSDQSLFPLEMSLDDLSKKGGVPKKKWTILDENNKSSKQKMFEIPSFPASLAKVFNANKAEVDENGSADGDSYGQEPISLTFSQFLLLLFTGEDKQFNFLNLIHEKGDPDESVRLIGNNEVFQTLLSLSKDPDPNKFAQMLGRYIDQSNSLERFFVLPNEDKILDDILTNVDRTQSGPVNSGAASSSHAILLGKLSAGNMSEKIIKNILEKLFGVAPKDQTDETINKIVGLYRDNKLASTSASFEHRVGAAVISHLLYGSLNKDKKLPDELDLNSPLFVGKNAKDLIDKIISLVHEALNSAIVVRNNKNDFQYTAVTRQIGYWIGEMGACLSNLHKAQTVEYRDLEKVIQAQAQVDPYKGKLKKTFNVDEIRKALEANCDKLVGVCEANVPGFIDSDNKQEIGSFFTGIQLTSAQSDAIIRMKDKYLNLSKKNSET